jgi:hypothetical protein
LVNPKVYSGDTWGAVILPVHYSIQADLCVVLTTMIGVLTQKELLDFCRDLKADHRFSPDFNQLVEVSPGAGSALHLGDLDAVRMADPFSLNSKRAIVVYSAVDFGVARMYEMMHGGKVQVFRSVREAMEFLGLPAE